jgi:hypothetical protein
MPWAHNMISSKCIWSVLDWVAGALLFSTNIRYLDMVYVHRQILLVDASCTTDFTCESLYIILNSYNVNKLSFFLLFCLPHLMDLVDT